jgi:hypothetical protein
MCGSPCVLNKGHDAARYYGGHTCLEHMDDPTWNSQYKCGEQCSHVDVEWGEHRKPQCTNTCILMQNHSVSDHGCASHQSYGIPF